MNPHHHLDPATVVSYAAGALPRELAVVVATHLHGCAHCRRRLREAERVGGLLLDQIPAPAGSDASAARRAPLREAMLAQLQAPVSDAPGAAAAESAVDARMERAGPRLPAPLRPYFGERYDQVRWRWMAPGVQCARAPGLPRLFMLRIGPGRRMPVHSHAGSEVTQILSGAYDDALGHFAAGDVADLDSEIEHQPVTSPGVPCICVSALDQPLRFRGWLARKLQPLFGL